jgi:hypothetical protein
VVHTALRMVNWPERRIPASANDLVGNVCTIPRKAIEAGRLRDVVEPGASFLLRAPRPSSFPRAHTRGQSLPSTQSRSSAAPIFASVFGVISLSDILAAYGVRAPGETPKGLA